MPDDSLPDVRRAGMGGQFYGRLFFIGCSATIAYTDYCVSSTFQNVHRATHTLSLKYVLSDINYY